MFRRFLVSLAASALFVGGAAATADQVSVDGQTLIGKIVEGTAAGLRINTASGERFVPARQIGPVVFEGAPTQMQKLRDDYFSGRYAAAAGAAEGLSAIAWPNPLMETEARFLTAIAAVRASLIGEDLDLAAAEDQLRGLASEGTNSFRRVAAAAALSESATARGDSAALASAASMLPNSDDPGVDALRGLWNGRAALLKDDFSSAAQAFASSEAAAAKAGDESLVLQAKLGGAAANRDVAAAIQAVQTLINQLTPGETLVHAQAYLTLGRLYQRAGAPVDAVLAYLHNDVLFAEHPVEYIAALRRLVPLWRELGRNDRSEKTAAELRRSYPQFAPSD